MSAAIPTVFGANALLFAGSYTALQVGRNLAATLLLSRTHALRVVFERILVWSVLSGVLWIAGGLADESMRLVFWGPALLVDLSAPLLGYRTPGLGRARTDEYPVEGGHFAERFQSFVIIALGESIVVTGASAATKGLDGLTIVALVSAFLVIGGLWWLYFGEVAENSRAQLAGAEDTGALARDAYTYLHLPIVAGIIMVAVGDELLISSPDGVLSTAGMVMTVGGPALYLAGESLFRLRMIGSVSLKRIITIAGLVVLGAAAGALSALAVSFAVALILSALAAWEYPPVRPSQAG
jgi:low temperature requirement protein LtrA